MTKLISKISSTAAVLAVATILATACGDEGGTVDAGQTPAQEPEGTAQVDDTSPAPDAPAARMPGTLVFGDETIELEPALCHLEEQDVVGSDGKILLTAQAKGTMADGERIQIDFTRYDEDSQFTGDDVGIDIGSITDPVSYSAKLALETVVLDGSTLRADDVTWSSRTEGAEASGSFELHC